MKYILFCILCFAGWQASAQELYPLTEPASNIPKQVLGVRLFNQSYVEPGNYLRTMTGLRLMYGATSRLTVMLNATASNHHSKDLPPDFPDHNTPQVGVKLPFRFNGINLYAKYRIISRDGENRHFRAALYGEYSYLDVAHDEAEPNLMDDTKGFGGGFITTYLHKRFAASFTGGVIIPSKYHGYVPDFIPGLPSIAATVKYGNAAVYNLSLGYLLLPKAYTSYNQTNFNIYLEVLGRSYDKARVYFDNLGSPGTPYEVKGSGVQALSANHYVELHPGIQAIIRSNLRIDFSVGVPVINRSYAHYYPLYSFGVQRYFYPRSKK